MYSKSIAVYKYDDNNMRFGFQFFQTNKVFEDFLKKLFEFSETRHFNSDLQLSKIPTFK